MRALRHCAAITCHHCGRDYAREYWASIGKGDPCVCNSCRRDTNIDAADAPRWTPSADAGELAREQIVSQSRKQCRVCGGEWDGLIFGSSGRAPGAPLPIGICPDCSAEEDAFVARQTAKIVPMGVPLELARPQRATEDE
jgi:hypothetical protein